MTQETQNTTPEQTPPAVGQNKSPESVPIPIEQLWTVDQAAYYMQVSAKTVYNRRKDGLPYSLIGGAVRFIPADVKAYVANHSRFELHRRRQIVRHKYDENNEGGKK